LPLSPTSHSMTCSLYTADIYSTQKLYGSFLVATTLYPLMNRSFFDELNTEIKTYPKINFQ